MRLKIKEWITDHKKGIIITACIAAGVVITIVVTKKIRAAHLTKRVASCHVKRTIPNKIVNSVEPVTEIIPVHSIESKAITEKLTGIMSTPTELGREVLTTPQEINKRLVREGFQTKLGDGYVLTEKGELLGNTTLKRTRYGHYFSNNEWDSSVLKYLFSEEELSDIERKKAVISEIMSCN